MEGNIDLVQGRGAKKQRLLLRKQGAVGGENYFEALFSGNLEKFPQVGMQQRLPHQMKVQKIRKGAQLGKQPGEFLHRHGMLFPVGSRAEGTA